VDSDFVSLAEVSGLAVPLGQWLLRAACRQAGAWRRQGHEGLVLGVSISARQLAHTAFAKLVRRVLDEAGLPASSLELAIPASELAVLADAVERLSEMRGLGLRTAPTRSGPRTAGSRTCTASRSTPSGSTPPWCATRSRARTRPP